jgi:hypothetical protein
VLTLRAPRKVTDGQCPCGLASHTAEHLLLECDDLAEARTTSKLFRTVGRTPLDIFVSKPELVKSVAQWAIDNFGIEYFGSAHTSYGTTVQPPHIPPMMDKFISRRPRQRAVPSVPQAHQTPAPTCQPPIVGSSRPVMVTDLPYQPLSSPPLSPVPSPSSPLLQSSAPRQSVLTANTRSSPPLPRGRKRDRVTFEES